MYACTITSFSLLGTSNSNGAVLIAIINMAQQNGLHHNDGVYLVQAESTDCLVLLQDILIRIRDSVIGSYKADFFDKTTDNADL